MKPKTIGIPSIFEEFEPFIKTLLNEFGYKIIKGRTTKNMAENALKNDCKNSDCKLIIAETTKKTVEIGTKVAENEQCVAVKIALGQINELSKKTDAILVPDIISVQERTWTCVKWLGLPYMAKTVVDDNIKIITPKADSYPDIGLLKAIKRVTNPTLAANIAKTLRLGFTSLQIMGWRLGKELGIFNPIILKAIIKAQKAQDNYWEKIQKKEQNTDPKNKRIAIIGHPYLLNDTTLNFNLFKKIKGYGEWITKSDKTNEKVWGITIITPESIPESIWEPYAKLYRKNIFWGNHRRMLGSLLYWIKKGKADGIVFLTGAFCGEDALMEILQNDIVKKAKIPNTRITLDEHAAEAGLITRIEAFIDTLPDDRIKPFPNVQELLPKPIKLPKEPVFSCPNLDYASQIMEILFYRLGLPFIAPVPTTDISTNLGVRYSPEFACRPFKTTLGNTLTTLEKHPEITNFLQAGGNGPCKFALYHDQQNIILKNLGFNVNFWPIKPPSEAGISEFFRCFSVLDQKNRPWIGKSEIWEFTKRALSKKEISNPYKDLKNGKTLWTEVIKTTFLFARLFDQLYKESLIIRPLEVQKGMTEKSFRVATAFVTESAKTAKLSNIPDITQAAFNILRAIPAEINLNNPKEVKIETEKLLKIAIGGEFYEVLARESNFDIAKWFGERRVYVERLIHPSDWLDPSRKNMVSGVSRKETIELAKPYLGFCGGDGQDTIGEIIHCHNKGFDAVIALRPLGCMPETVAAQIIPYLPKHGINIPVLVVTYDDQKPGGAHLLTRLEALLDQMRIKKSLPQISTIADHEININEIIAILACS